MLLTALKSAFTVRSHDISVNPAATIYGTILAVVPNNTMAFDLNPISLEHAPYRLNL